MKVNTRYSLICVAIIATSTLVFKTQKPVVADDQGGANTASMSTWADVKRIMDGKYNSVQGSLLEGNYFAYRNSEKRKSFYDKVSLLSGGDHAIIPVDANRASHFRWITSSTKWMCENFVFYPESQESYTSQNFDGEKFTSNQSLTRFNLVSPTPLSIPSLDFIYRNGFRTLQEDPILGSGVTNVASSMLFGQPESSIRFAGKEVSQDDTLYIFEIENDKVQARMYFSPSKKLIVRSHTRWKMLQGDPVEDLALSNFRLFSGIVLPMTVKHEYYLQKGQQKEWQQTLFIRFTQVNLNKNEALWSGLPPVRLGERVRDDVSGDTITRKGQLSNDDIITIKNGVPPKTEEADAVVKGDAASVVAAQEKLVNQYVGR